MDFILPWPFSAAILAGQPSASLAKNRLASYLLQSYSDFFFKGPAIGNFWSKVFTCFLNFSDFTTRAFALYFFWAGATILPRRNNERNRPKKSASSLHPLAASPFFPWDPAPTAARKGLPVVWSVFTIFFLEKGNAKHKPLRAAVGQTVQGNGLDKIRPRHVFFALIRY